MKREEHGRKHMTKEQLRSVLAGIDAAAEKDIPDSARRQMAHRPYQKRGGKDNVDGRNSSDTGSVESRGSETPEEEI